MKDIEWEGIKLLSLVFGLIGAVLGVSYSEPMSKRQMFAALIAGLVCAALGPQAVLHYLTLPPWFVNALAFVFGIGGMFIVPGVLAFWRAFATDPWAWIDRIRGAKTGDKGGDK